MTKEQIEVALNNGIYGKLKSLEAFITSVNGVRAVGFGALEDGYNCFNIKVTTKGDLVTACEVLKVINGSDLTLYMGTIDYMNEYTLLFPVKMGKSWEADEKDIVRGRAEYLMEQVEEQETKEDCVSVVNDFLCWLEEFNNPVNDEYYEDYDY